MNNLVDSVYLLVKDDGVLADGTPWSLDTANASLEDIADELALIDIDAADYSEDEIRQAIKDAVKVYTQIASDDRNFYKERETYLQLSDERTLWKIDFPESVDDTYLIEQFYPSLVNLAVDDFEREKGVTVYVLGRNGRHICVENTYANAVRFEELQNYVQELEQLVIKAMKAKIDDIVQGETE